MGWLKENHISHIGVSYRLDTDNAVDIVGQLVHMLRSKGAYESSEAFIRSIYFAGLTAACDKIDQEYAGRIRTFHGGKSVRKHC